ncbi:hypothetical protein WR25_05550 [Diploscapter pachys]|uniref:Uncharacterized protein n=1 Tax=Diploscapter pachys TaxID=2018661 RepID=A0A2A2K3P3_9BILA|nr:hypothetical protein WR25_05550 [Diploscapter pachys]
MLDRGAGAERGIDIGLQRNATAAAAAFVGGNDQFRSAIADPVGERVGGKAAEHDRMDRADPRTGEHRRRRIGHHRQVERHAVTASDAKRRQHIRHPADAIVQGAIGDARAFAGFVAFPQDRDLIAPRRQMPVEAIGRYVDLAAVEPADPEIVGREGHVLHRIERPHPVELCGLIAPIGIGRLDRGAALVRILGRADAAGTCRGRWNDIAHEAAFRDAGCASGGNAQPVDAVGSEEQDRAERQGVGARVIAVVRARHGVGVFADQRHPAVQAIARLADPARVAADEGGDRLTLGARQVARAIARPQRQLADAVGALDVVAVAVALAAERIGRQQEQADRADAGAGVIIAGQACRTVGQFGAGIDRAASIGRQAADRVMALDQPADPQMRTEASFGRHEVVGRLGLEADRLVRLGAADRGEWLEDACRELEAAELGRGIGDLWLEVGVDIPQPDPAERRIGRRGIARGGADRQQCDVVQDRIRPEQADIAADLDLAEATATERQIGLAEIDAGGLQRLGGARAVRAGIAQAGIDAGIHAEMRADVPAALGRRNVDLQEAGQQPVADRRRVVADAGEPARDGVRRRRRIGAVMDVEAVDGAGELQRDIADHQPDAAVRHAHQLLVVEPFGGGLLRRLCGVGGGDGAGLCRLAGEQRLIFVLGQDSLFLQLQQQPVGRILRRGGRGDGDGCEGDGAQQAGNGFHANPPLFGPWSRARVGKADGDGRGAVLDFRSRTKVGWRGDDPAFPTARPLADDDAPGCAADRDRGDGLGTGEIDDGDRVGQAVAGNGAASIRRDRNAPHARADGNDGARLARRGVDDRDRIAATQSDHRLSRIGGEADLHGHDLLGSDARHGEVQRVDHLAAGDVDHRHAVAQLRRHPQLLAVRSEFGVARPVARRRGRHHLAPRDVDPVDRIVRFGGGDREPSVGADRHPFGLDADDDLERDLAARHVDRGHRRIAFVRGEQQGAVRRQREGFGILPRRQVGDDLARCQIDHLHGVFVAGADVQLLAVTRQDDAARASADGPGRGDLERGGVDDADRIGALVRDIDRLGGSGSEGGGEGRNEEQGSHDRILAHPGAPPLRTKVQ